MFPRFSRPDKLIEWKSASLRSGVSSFGFSGTNGHGLMEVTVGQPAEMRAPMQFNRKANSLKGMGFQWCSPLCASFFLHVPAYLRAL